MIRCMAIKFRDAIEGNSFAAHESPTLVNFPHRACGDSSILLGEYFLQNGELGWQYVVGVRESDGHSHAWLEKDGLIVDITSDQFDSARDAVTVTRDATWHGQFVVDPQTTHLATISIYGEGYAKDMLTRAYKTIVKEIF